MSDLSEGGKVLVKAGKLADRPSAADRQRVLLALQARLGDAALLAGSAAEASRVASSGAAAARSKYVKWGSWVGSAMLVAGAASLAPRFTHRSEKIAPAASASVASAPRASTVAVPVDDAPQPAPAPSVPVAAPEATRPVAPEGANRSADAPKSSSRPSRDGLAEEVALLSRAETELHAGRPAKALTALAEHQRKFPRGALAEERTAARIQALCALGRTDEANAQLRQLLHISPNSPLEERARQACRSTP
ncbi:MAG TPA: hypothetical protein VER11_32700 [Polyangiaceae bacterium]|nr:hypothetical protein [Polyangiaceae bacterium]